MKKKIYTIITLIAIFIIYFASVKFESKLFGNIFAPIVTFASSFIIFDTIKRTKNKQRKLYWSLVFLFVLSWFIADFSWLIYDEIFSINPINIAIINIIYTLPNVFLAILITIYYINNFKKWNKYQLILDNLAIDSILLILLWTFMFSQNGIAFRLNFDYLNTLIYLFIDFYILSGIATMIISFNLKKFEKHIFVVLFGALIFVFTDFYYAYLYFNDFYVANTMIDGVYTIPNVLFAIGAILAEPVCMLEDEFEEKMLPENYRKTRYLNVLLLVFLVLYIIKSYSLEILFASTCIILIHQFFTSIIQDTIRREYLLKKEVQMNEHLENEIKERTEELICANKSLVEISNKDALTGLYNRRYLIDYLDSLILNRPADSFALLYMDLDRFKSINDTYGHPIGDKMLDILSKRFIDNCQPNCTVFRVGGDEFVLLIEKEVHQSYIYKIIEKILDLMQQPIFIEPYVFRTGVSIGIALYPQDARDRDLLMKYADIAMYEAKINCRDSHYMFFHSNISQKIQRQHEIELLLKNVDFAKEFLLYYQPQYRSCDHSLVGVEALLRWRQPEQGMIPPLEFIPIAEEIGVIHQLGKWVIGEAFSQIKRWNETYHLDLKIGINVSPIQMEDIHFLTWVQEKLKNDQINPNWIDLEITEGSAMNATISMEELFDKFSNLGVTISIDDFGTGYSSLSYIKKFHINTLKIAKELIDNIAEDHNTLLIVRAIVMMAKGMQLKTIAEGVEEIKQMEILKKIGCDEIQGYYFGKPLPADELEKEHIIKNINNKIL
ncbi:MAG: EAL domain-containing protein [Anaerovorax sp.]|nr:EAL domain-containing protein [Anaerovorax sp.]